MSFLSANGWNIDPTFPVLIEISPHGHVYLLGIIYSTAGDAWLPWNEAIQQKSRNLSNLDMCVISVVE